jgi:hypothetical protein
LILGLIPFQQNAIPFLMTVVFVSQVAGTLCAIRPPTGSTIVR